MRKFVQINGELVEMTRDRPLTHEIIGDFKEPVKSMIDGKMYDSRSAYVEHLKRHGYTVVGNDSSLTKPYTGMPTASKQRKEELIRVVNSMTEKEFRAAGRRELEQWKWNTRGR